MKNKNKQKRQIRFSLLWCLLGAGLLVLSSVTVQSARADQYDQQIQSLQQQNSQTETDVSQLEEQAGSYQDAIDRLQSQITQLQQQISENQSKQAYINRQIQDTQLQLDVQRQTLGDIIKTMYVGGRLSTLEVLASSKNMSDFLDKEEYLGVVRNKIQASLQLIKQLQAKLQTQKAQVDRLLNDQTSQRTKLSADQTQQAQLLAYNQSQQTAYDQQVKNNQVKIDGLRRQQAQLIAQYLVSGTTAGDANHGGYPTSWNNAAQDSVLDTWGMYNRECVSYTAFKVHQGFLAGKNKYDMPYWGGIGDAKQWPSNARTSGITVDTNPTPGSIAISTAGNWGHSMYVESVGRQNGQLSIYVSQYNADFSGHYSEGWRYITGLVFIHF